jgi:two-component system nitrogen regulation sensor histidine kinase NtrY
VVRQLPDGAATALGVPVVAIMQSPDKVLARANIDVLRDAAKPDQAAFDDAMASPEPICVIPPTGAGLRRADEAAGL